MVMKAIMGCVSGGTEGLPHIEIGFGNSTSYYYRSRISTDETFTLGDWKDNGTQVILLKNCKVAYKEYNSSEYHYVDGVAGTNYGASGRTVMLYEE